MKKLTLLILVSLFILPAVLAYKVDPDELTYTEKEVVGYSALNIRGIDNQGYTQGKSFKWKVDMYLPEETFVYAQPVSKIVLRIRNATKPFTVPKEAVFTGMERYPLTGNFRTVTGIKDLDVVYYHSMWSVGGNSIASTPQQNTIAVNNGRYQKVTIHLPEKPILKKIGDAERPKDVIKMDESTYFFPHIELPAVVYYDPGKKSAVQKGLILILILATIALFTLAKFIPSFNIKSKHMLLALILTFLLMAQFAQIVPNPEKTVLNLQKSTKPFETDKKVLSTFTTYLWNTIGLTKTIDYAIIGNSYKCGSKQYFLTERSAEKIFVVDKYENYRCSRNLFENFNSSKIEVMSIEEIEEELSKEGSLRHPFKKLFITNAKLITFLSAILFSFLSAYLILLVVEIKKTKIWLAAIIMFVSYFLLKLFYTLIGYIAHMPVSYHGNLPFGMTLTAFFMPDTVFGGNTVRLIFSVLGVLILIFSRMFRRKINIALVFVPILFMILLLALPQTEFMAKREVITVMSGEGFLYDQRIGNAFSLKEMYTKMRNEDYKQVQNYLCTRDDLKDSLTQKVLACESKGDDTK